MPFEETNINLYKHLDMINAMKTKYEEGIEEGIGIGIEQVTIRCLQQGKSINEICSITDLSEKDVKVIQRKINIKL